MEFKVIAKQMGYYNHVRRREDSVFLMNEKDFVKVADVKDKKSLEGRVILKGDSGEVVLPKWVKLAKGQDQAQQKSKQKPKQEVVQDLEDDEVI